MSREKGQRGAKPQKTSAANSETGQKLQEAAIGLFSGKWYGTVSVAEICRRAGLSNGCFYRYHENKEELFRLLLEQTNDRVAETLRQVGGRSPSERLRSFTRIVYDFSQSNKELVRIFREGQYRFYEFEQRLKTIYVRALEKVFAGPVSSEEYIFALGGLRFSSIRAALHGIDIQPKALCDILEHGLFRNMSIEPEKVFSGSLSLLPYAGSPDASERLMREGKKLFGKQGFFATNIHAVADAANLSVGAFYTYFESKEAFYAQLIRRVGREVRHFISSNLGAGLNRLERELRGIWLFTVYLSLDPYCYNLVREAEFVLPEEVRDYYAAFAKGYRQQPEGSDGMHENTSIEFLLGVSHYLGLEVVFDGAPGNTREQVEKIGALLSVGLSKRLERKL